MVSNIVDLASRLAWRHQALGRRASMAFVVVGSVLALPDYEGLAW